MTHIESDRPNRHLRADGQVVVTFTNRGERALDHFAAVITHGMARTPHYIADVLATIYHTPLDELVAAFNAIAADIEGCQQATAFICRPCRDGRHSDCDDAMRRPTYRGCCCQHKPADDPEEEPAIPAASHSLPTRTASGAER